MEEDHFCLIALLPKIVGYTDSFLFSAPCPLCFRLIARQWGLEVSESSLVGSNLRSCVYKKLVFKARLRRE